MSKGEIIEHMGEGLYRVRQKFAVERIQQELAQVRERLAELAVELPTAKLELEQADGAVASKAGEIDQLIPDYAAGTEGALQKITALQAELMRLASEAGKLRLKVAELIAEDLANRKRQNQLEQVPEGREMEVWCADYTEDLAGEVGLVDINDEGGGTVAIQPGFDDAAIYDPSRDGALFPDLAQSGPQIYFNAAILPGVQKWMPRYRVGTITEIEKDICTVELEPATSSVQALNINQTLILEDIPIQYMDCNGDAFEAGDSVLVRYFKEGPQVVGFPTNPRACSVEMMWHTLERQSVGGSYDIQRLGRIGRNDPTLTITNPIVTSVSLYDDEQWSCVSATGNIFSGGGKVAEFPSNWIANDIGVIENANTGTKEIWVSGVDANNDPVVRVFSEAGAVIRDIQLMTAAQSEGGFVFLAVSPHYYAFAVNSGIEVRRIADNTTAAFGSWCDTYPHEQNGLLDVTDEVVAWACETSVVCRSLKTGLNVPVTVDHQYLAFDTVIDGFTRNITGLQLSNRTLTVFGANRYIHYRMLVNEEGHPYGFEEVSRNQFSDFENYSLSASTNRALLTPVAPE